MLFLAHLPELVHIIMTASSTTARCLSLAVLLLSMAPLASLYVLLFSFLGGMEMTVITDSGSSSSSVTVQSSSTTTTTASVFPTLPENVDWSALGKNRTALEEVLQSLFQEATRESHLQQFQQQPWSSFWMSIREATMVPTDTTTTTTAGGVTTTTVTVHHHHWSLVLPWLLTFFLGVVVPTMLSIWSFLRQYRRRRRRSRDPTRHRKNQLLKSVHKYSKELAVSDQAPPDIAPMNSGDSCGSDCTAPEVESSATSCCDSETCFRNNDATDNQACTTASGSKNTPAPWLIPFPGTTARDAIIGRKALRIAPSTSCIVCLNRFQVGERIAWSANPKCVHVFHQDCIHSWLRRSQTMECPCCRQGFLTCKPVVHQTSEPATVHWWW